MNPKTLQYLDGTSDIELTMNTYTHLSLDDAKNEMICMDNWSRREKKWIRQKTKADETEYVQSSLRQAADAQGKPWALFCAWEL